MATATELNLSFLGIFLLGLGLNLTPCVYPMLSITISLFRSQHETSRWHAFFKACFYVLGMATIYSALGVATAFTGGLFGAMLQSKWVLFGIGLLMVGMAASLFGFYVIQAPQWLIKVASKRGSDFLGVFLSGLFVGVFAAPCVGPLIIALIAFVAQKGDPAYAFQTFFILSMGLGLPYILLGTFAGLANKLPKSGIWLIWVDRLFGTILLGVGCFYFSLALNPALLPWLLPVGLAVGGLYLGFIERNLKETKRFIVFKRIVGSVAIVTGIALHIMAPAKEVQWQPFSAQALEQALSEKNPVVLDFYADWCIPCHELDRFTYTNEKVIKALDAYIRFKVDLTNPDDEATSKLIDDYEVLGVPTVLFIGKNGKEAKAARLTGFVPAQEFLENLKNINR